MQVHRCCILHMLEQGAEKFKYCWKPDSQWLMTAQKPKFNEFTGGLCAGQSPPPLPHEGSGGLQNLLTTCCSDSIALRLHYC
ncbi:hypothetical protein GDO81_025195 [Engystomops pustulosus]|uniref:Uncharacterized protein n=1 Tax=Engystomops pustulosus TaxID=76066 RepID=A0AAV6Z267_ENGPU|nr:hypothetical protein GDO81_025195 [Engystomops pustulosus]